jgi:pimeloyl-ACP methyl ester carboxylesterase
MAKDSPISDAPLLRTTENDLIIPLTKVGEAVLLSSTEKAAKQKSFLSSAMIFMGSMVIFALTFVYYTNLDNHTNLTDVNLSSHTVVNVETPLGYSFESPLDPHGYPLNDIVLKALESSDTVAVTRTEKMVTFTPTNNPKSIGYIFLPGGNVAFESYAPLVRRIAESGVFVAIPKVAFNLAIADQNAPDRVFNAYGDKHENWFVGGHSLGATVACFYAKEKYNSMVGLILFDGFATKGKSLYDLPLRMLSVESGIKSSKKWNAFQNAEQYNPKDTEYYVVQGGNHRQFGDYGEIQPFDTVATISREEEQNIAAAAVIDYIARRF